MTILKDIAHVLGIDDTSSNWYGFWSGFAGNIPLFGGFGLMFKKHVCHKPGCLRVGLHAIDGTPYVVCKKHHPEIGDK